MVKTFRGSRWLNILGTIVCLLVFASPAFAEGGNVLPPTAQPEGYSLAEAAAATAHFNTGPRTPDTLPEGFPFQILWVAPGSSENTIHVEPGTAFYAPVFYSDDTDAAYLDYPDVTDPQAVRDYYFDPAQLGAEYLNVVIDGDVTTLGPEYAVGEPRRDCRRAAITTPWSPRFLRRCRPVHIRSRLRVASRGSLS
jgi:hypothetical protein